MKKAFTTIELIIMITLLSIILVLIVPNFLTYLDNSAKSEYETTKEALEKATEAYIIDHGGYEDYAENTVTLAVLQTEGYIDQKTIDSLNSYANSGLAGSAITSINSNAVICIDRTNHKINFDIDQTGC